MSEEERMLRRISRSVVNEMENRGIGMSFAEAKALAQVEGSDASEFRCANPKCGAPITDPSIDRCPSCGSRTATTVVASQALYRCERCGRPISDPKSMSRCPSCGHGKVVPASAKSNPKEYSCIRCSAPVSPDQSACGCGETRCVRGPIRTVIS